MEKEYCMLRDEIMENAKSMRNYVSITFTTVAAIVAYIANNPDNPNMFIAIFIILVAVSSRVKSLLEGNVCISTYMEIFLEPTSNEYKWETRNHYRLGKYNIHKIENRSGLLASLLFRTNSTYLLLGIFVYIFFIIILINNFSIFNLLIGGFFNTVSLLILIYIASIDANDKHRDEFINYWKGIKEEINT